MKVKIITMIMFGIVKLVIINEETENSKLKLLQQKYDEKKSFKLNPQKLHQKLKVYIA